MVLAPEPHHIVARLIQPVAVTEDGAAHPAPHGGLEVLALMALPDPEQRNQGKVGAILAGADPCQGIEQQLIGLGR
ncbi:hypothetical protein D3C87_2010730 [compost metagenome]